MRFSRCNVLIYSLAFSQYVIAGIPRPDQLHCSFKCLDIITSDICSANESPSYKRRCLCKKENSQELRRRLPGCLARNSTCSKSEIQQVIKGTYEACQPRKSSTTQSSTTQSSTSTTSTSSLTSTSPSTSPTQTSSSTHTKPGSGASQDESSSGLSKGASAGIGVAVSLVILAIIATIAYVLFKRRRKQRQHDEETKRMSQENDSDSTRIRAELVGQDMRHEVEDSRGYGEAPPAYIYEKEGMPVSELATNQSPMDVSELHELPSATDTIVAQEEQGLQSQQHTDGDTKVALADDREPQQGDQDTKQDPDITYDHLQETQQRIDGDPKRDTGQWSFKPGDTFTNFEKKM